MACARVTYLCAAVSCTQIITPRFDEPLKRPGAKGYVTSKGISSKYIGGFVIFYSIGWLRFEKDMEHYCLWG